MQHLEEGTIHAWIDGALSTAEARDVESHLATCESCSTLAAEARGLVAASSRILTALDDVPGDVIPIALPSNAPASTPGVTPIQTAVPRRRFTPFWMRTAAAVLVIAGTSALVMTGKLNSPEAKRAELMLDSMPADLAMKADVPAAAPAPFSATDLASAAPDSFAAANRTSVRGSAPAAVAAATTLNAESQVAARSTAPSASAPATLETRVAGSQTADRSLQDRQAQQQAITAREETLTQAREQIARSERDARKVGDVAGSLAGPQSVKAAAPAADARASSLATSGNRPPNTRNPIASAGAAASAVVGSAADAMRGRTRAAPTALAAESAEVRSASGCYALSMSPWSGGTIPFGSPPPRIELDTIRNSLGQLLVHPARGTAANGAPRAYWTQQADSVFVTWRDESRGVRLSLPVVGEVLRGRAETIPVGSAAQSSVVEATRISCQR